MAYQQAAQAYEAAPGVEEAEAPAAQVYEAPPEVAQPEPAAAVEQLAAAGNNKRKAEEHGVSEEEHMRKRASFNGPADPEPANGVSAALLLLFTCLTCKSVVAERSKHRPDTRARHVLWQAATRATGFSDAPPAGAAAYQLFSEPQPAVQPQAAPAPAMQASQAGFTDVVDIPAGMVGKLIGKGGETIKQLQYSTQTKIQIDHMTQGDIKKVSITGASTDLVEAAKAQVMQVVAGDDRGGEAQNTVECPQGIVGRIIGRGGETIRALQQASQAHIVVDQNYPEGQPRRVNISGRPDAVDRATKMVSELIAGEPGSAQAIIQKVRCCCCAPCFKGSWRFKVFLCSYVCSLGCFLCLAALFAAASCSALARSASFASPC